jgi:hypothetical protein
MHGTWTIDCSVFLSSIELPRADCGGCDLLLLHLYGIVSDDYQRMSRLLLHTSLPSLTT